MASTTKITVVGCGWLGFPLAQNLVQKGYEVIGTTTTVEKLPQLRSAGIVPVLLNLNDADANVEAALDVDVLVLNLPSSKQVNQDGLLFPHLIQKIQQSNLKALVYTSSTSVYPNLNREVDESDAQHSISQHSGIDLLALEQAILSIGIPTTIVRLGGLFGAERKPGRFLAGKKNVKGGSTPVNLLHLDDAVAIISQIVLKQAYNEVFNAVSPEHPSKLRFYSAAAQKLNLEQPVFAEEEKEVSFKIVSCRHLQKTLNYKFIHPDPLNAL